MYWKHAYEPTRNLSSHSAAKTASRRAIYSKYFLRSFLLWHHLGFDTCIRLQLNHRPILASGITDVSNMVIIHQIATQKTFKIKNRTQNFSGPTQPSVDTEVGIYIYVCVHLYIYMYISHTPTYVYTHTIFCLNTLYNFQGKYIIWWLSIQFVSNPQSFSSSG